MSNSSKEWCICGDFNVVRRQEDRLNSQINVKEIEDFNNFINITRLVEIPLGGRKFTRISDDGLKFSKLDRVLVSEGFKNKWGNLSMVALARKCSYHCPIVLKDMDVDFGPKPFRVFDVWLKEADIENVVLREARRLWMDKKREKTFMLRQKARVRWNIDGDENSKFFHSFVKRRNKKNNIRGIMVDDLWCEDPEKIKEETYRFYKNIFLEQEGHRPQLSCNGLSQLSSNDVNMLEKQFEEKEVWEAVKSCGGDKAPSPDGKEISRGCNSSFVALLPKAADPIGLGEVQNAFISDKFILDGILIANETVYFVKKNKSKGLIFKVDFEKAYDSINWRYLFNILKSMGFEEKWCSWIDACLRSSSMSVLVNGSPTIKFGLERGVRQGDPLSPFLFILAAEGLNSMIKKAVNKGIFKGINVGSVRVSGIKVNLSKSRLYGVGVNPNEVSNMASWMQCSVGEFPFTYLGLPIGDCMRRETAWRNVETSAE
ncbi:reverse transcriptase domain, reverse transcriptase zinc-binding domain protein [Tanacetum coccineum]